MSGAWKPEGPLGSDADLQASTSDDTDIVGVENLSRHGPPAQVWVPGPDPLKAPEEPIRPLQHRYDAGAPRAEWGPDPEAPEEPIRP